MFTIIYNAPWFLLLFIGFVIGLLYYALGVGVLLWMDSVFVWFSKRMEARGSFFGALLLVSLWPLTILAFCLSHRFKVWRYGVDRYAPKAA